MVNKNGHVSNLISLGLLVLFLGAVGYYFYHTRPCAQPIYYKIGTFDTRFNISEEEFLDSAAIAANLWNREVGHTVLAYSATGTMSMNLIYDERQKQANLGESILIQQAALTTEKNQIAAMRTQYNLLKQEYLEAKAQGEDVPRLNAKVDALNQLNSQIQARIDALNEKIDVVNSNADVYNEEAGSDFNQGEYTQRYGSSRIDLYQFENKLQLERLVAHEFGHALGLLHGSNPKSIMYPKNKADTRALSSEDKTMIQERCQFSLKSLNPFTPRFLGISM